MATHEIVVDLSQRRLALYQSGKLSKSYPVGIGRRVTQTPAGEFMIINKQPNPGGPFGSYWLGLSKRHYGIHGTDDPSSIGKEVSHGCIRMLNADVFDLAKRVSLGTSVEIRP